MVEEIIYASIPNILNTMKNQLVDNWQLFTFIALANIIVFIISYFTNRKAFFKDAQKFMESFFLILMIIIGYFIFKARIFNSDVLNFLMAISVPLAKYFINFIRSR